MSNPTSIRIGANSYTVIGRYVPDIAHGQKSLDIPLGSERIVNPPGNYFYGKDNKQMSTVPEAVVAGIGDAEDGACVVFATNGGDTFKVIEINSGEIMFFRHVSGTGKDSMFRKLDDEQAHTSNELCNRYNKQVESLEKSGETCILLVVR